VVGANGGREGFACSRPAVEIAAGLSTFSNGADTGASSSGGTAIAAQAEQPAGKQKADDDGGGVLPAVSDQIRDLPGILPTPSIPSASTSPHRVIGLAALALLILGGLALVVYVLRFLRKPHAT
jgi:hypothetical protein